MDVTDVQVTHTSEKPIPVICGCGRVADSLCSCKFPSLPLLPLCSLCCMQHFANERGDHHQLPAQAYRFVTSVNTFREAILRITKYEVVKRKLEDNMHQATHSDRQLLEASTRLIATIERIRDEGVQTLRQTKQAVVHGRDRIVELMERKLFDTVPYFPSVEETELFQFELGLPEVEKALEHFGKVPRSKYDMDLSDIMKTEERDSSPSPEQSREPSAPPAPAEAGEVMQKPRKMMKVSNRRNKLDRIFQIVLPPNQAFKCRKHKDQFWSAKALVKHLRHKHEKFRSDMMPSDAD